MRFASFEAENMQVIGRFHQNEPQNIVFQAFKSIASKFSENKLIGPQTILDRHKSANLPMHLNYY